MTEADIKLTWCPHSRVAGDNGSSINRVFDAERLVFVPTSTFCTGSACSQFRSDESQGTVWCGLAGRP